MQQISLLIWLSVGCRSLMKTSPRFALLTVVAASLALTGISRPVPRQERALCCLCMCHSVDENQCSRDCVKLQHGTKIIEEPEMNVCTKSCLKHGVRQIVFSEDGTRFVVTQSLAK